MADTVVLRAQLDDGVSGPASRIKASIDAIGSSLRSVGGAFRTFASVQSSAFSSAGAGAIGQIGSAIGGLRSEIAGLSGPAGIAATAVKKIGTAVLAVTAALATMAAAAAAAFTTMALKTAAFRETTVGAFEVMLRSQGEAAGLWERAVKFAAKTPFNTQQVIGGFKQLLARGFETSQLERIMTAAGDLSAAMGEPQAMPRIIRALGQIRGKGRLQMEELNQQLAEVGVNTAEVVAEIGRTLGKSSDEVRRMITKGAISSEVGVNAILTVVERRFGGTMARLMTTLTGLWEQLASRPFELFNAALNDSKSGLNKFISVIKRALSFLVVAFDPGTERGGRLVAIITFIGDALGRIFGMAAGGDKLADIFDGVLNAIEIIVPIFTGFIEGFMEGLGEVGGPLLRILGAILGIGQGATRMEKIAAVFKVIGKAVAYVLITIVAIGSVMGTVIGAIVGVLGTIVGTITAMGAALLAFIGAMISTVIQAIETLVGWITGAGESVDRGMIPTEDVIGRIGAFGMQAGSSLVGGIVSGIASAAGAVVGQMMALGQAAANAFAGAIPGGGALLGAAAPMGGFGVGGAGVGIPVGGMPAPAAKPMGAERGGPTSNTFNLSISGAGLTPDELMARARAEFSSMIENL